MKKLLGIVVLSLLLCNSSMAEILRLGCVEPDKSDEVVEYKFDLKKNIYTTITGTEIDAAFTDEEIIFQSYLFILCLILLTKNIAIALTTANTSSACPESPSII